MVSNTEQRLQPGSFLCQAPYSPPSPSPRPSRGCCSRRDGSPTHGFISQAQLLRSDPGKELLHPAIWEAKQGKSFLAREKDLGGPLGSGDSPDPHGKEL